MTEQIKGVMLQSDFPALQLLGRGKVRDSYDLGEDLLIVATDRISAFDVILPNGIPRKGEVLNRLSEFFFNLTANIVPNHVITTDVTRYPSICQQYADQLRGRSMLVKKARPLTIECIVRGNITGSGWKDYKKTGVVCGIKLPEGLLESQQLAEPIFTPSTKAPAGKHDENISFTEACAEEDPQFVEQAKDLAIAAFIEARDYAKKCGIIIADTKMEFGVLDGKLILIDELLTPDSSRFWPADEFEPGRAQNSYDKQYVRDYLIKELEWDQKPPVPVLPEFICQGTSQRYLKAYQLLTGVAL